MLSIRLAQSGILDLNGTLIAEVIAFLVMFAILAKWVYPFVLEKAEERQRQIAEQLAAAEKARHEAEERLRNAQQQLDETRQRAQEIIDGANRSGEQLRGELRQKGQEEAERAVERAKREIEAERNRAVESIRADVADLVVNATEKVLGEVLDESRHRRLIDQAIQEVGVESNGNSPS